MTYEASAEIAIDIDFPAGTRVGISLRGDEETVWLAPPARWYHRLLRRVPAKQVIDRADVRYERVRGFFFVAPIVDDFSRADHALPSPWEHGA